MFLSVMLKCPYSQALNEQGVHPVLEKHAVWTRVMNYSQKPGYATSKIALLVLNYRTHHSPVIRAF